MKIKNEFSYFEMFIKMAQCSLDAAKQLKKTLENYSSSTDLLDEMHEIEHQGDELHHTLMDELNRSFITPIEREDIMSLGDSIDDLTDTVEDVVVRLYMFNVQKIRPEAIELADITVSACETLILAFSELKNFKKSKEINKHIIEINRFEEVADNAYHKAMRRLFTENTDSPLELIQWREVFQMQENCCDKCEELADIIGGVVMKNT